jgi:putative ABC transport system ATP-binding protein
MTGPDQRVDAPPTTEPEVAFALTDVWVPGGDDRWRLRGVTASIPAQGITVVVGASGSGKSTLLRCCNRLESWSKGTITYLGSDVTDLDVLQLRRRVAMVFQKPTPFSGTGLDNLRAGVPDLDERRGKELLARVQLGPEILDRNAGELSGGEAQRLCLARSLAVEPDVVLMDEVTSSVDPAASRALEQLARDLADDGTPVVWVTHDLAQARRLADTMLVVHGGRIATPAEAEAFLEDGERGE